MSVQFYTDDLPQVLLSYVNGAQWSTFADLGCGEGVILNALWKRGLLDGKSVYAVDLSEDRLSRVKQINSQIVCVPADACHTPIASGSVDFLISTQVIEHVPDDEALVKEIQRILQPGGVAYVDTIFKKWYGWYFYRCNGKWTIDPSHLREYSSDDQLLDHFRRHGLEIVATRKTLRRTPVIDSALRRLGAPRSAYDNKFLKVLRNVTLPIAGYYIWGIVCKKQ